MCSDLYGSQNKQRCLSYALTDWFGITAVESVYCAVRNEALCKRETSRLYKGLMNKKYKSCEISDSEGRRNIPLVLKRRRQIVFESKVFVNTSGLRKKEQIT